MTSLCDQLEVSTSPFILIEDTLAAPAGFLMYHKLKDSLKEGNKVAHFCLQELHLVLSIYKYALLDLLLLAHVGSLLVSK